MAKQTKPHSKKKPAPQAKRRSTRKQHCLAPSGALQRQFDFQTEGQHYDLREIFDRVNRRYFRNRLRDYVIKWGPRRRKKPLRTIVFGCIQEEDRVIRINPLLDREFVPWWYIEYVVFHEMLHAFVPDRYDSAGRRIVHHEGFLERERRFRQYKAAIAWERENLARFLR